jgi:hypothetical protein
VTCSQRCQSDAREAKGILWAIELGALYDNGRLTLADLDAYQYAIASYVARARADAKADAKAIADEVAAALGAPKPIGLK